MSENSSTLFLSNLSVIDHAYIDNKGNVVGGSFNPSFIVTGKVDPIEQVVVDFSTIKHDIKDCIDHKETGFDHKLWILVGYSNCSYSFDFKNITITTPTTKLTMPLDAVKFINGIAEYDGGQIGDAIKEQVEQHLNRLYANVNIKVKCNNNTIAQYPVLPGAAADFRYVHGLKDSSSWGCQNISHGHGSFVLLVGPKGSMDMHRLVEKITSDINDAVFIKQENIIENTDSAICIGYTTKRGTFRATYSKSAYNIIVLETETTVEHLVEYVFARYINELKNNNVQTIYVSEGRNKGSCINL